MNINDFTQIYRQTIKSKSDGSTTVRLNLDRVDPKKIRVLSHVTVENKSSGYTKCRLGINASSRIHYVDELQTIAAKELAVSRSDIVLGEGDVFFAEMTDTGDGNVLVMTCIGWEFSI